MQTTNIESKGKTVHLMYCPFTGLGLYDGFRGNKWLKNRITIFKQFVIPSLQAQTCQDFILWVSWRPEERTNKQVKELKSYLNTTGIKCFFTYSGVCFWDDKYPPEVARDRLIMALHGASGELINATEGESGYEWTLMTIQPSDDCYHKDTVKEIQTAFKGIDVDAIGFTKGYIMNHQTLEIAEWNPKTNPPFYTIKFPRPIFINPQEHLKFTSLKHDVQGYPAGTPLPSHEWVSDCMRYGKIEERGFLVGTHGVNISTIWNHPYKGASCPKEVLSSFGLEGVEPLKLPFNPRRVLISKLPHKIQRKLRYWAGEKRWILRPLFGIIYNGLR